MRQDIYQMIRYWLDLGIDGFRLDAISHIQKEDWSFKLKSMKDNDPWEPFMNVDGIEDYMLELRAVFDEYDIMTVGEASGVNGQRALEWTSEGGFINMIFELEHNHQRGIPGSQTMDVFPYKQTYAKWQRELENGGWNAPYVENHDNPRINSVLGNETAKSAKAIGLYYLFLSGTPFIFQGQELGMTNTPFAHIDEMNDGADKKRYQDYILEGDSEELALKKASRWSRDHSRTPFQWDSSENAGFSTTTPWLKVNSNYPYVNVDEELKDDDSVLHFYKKMIALRKAEPVFTEGEFIEILPNHPSVMGYMRVSENKTMLILVNLENSEQTIILPKLSKGKVLLSNSDFPGLATKIILKEFDAFLIEIQ
jgi:alpha-glucosidase